MQLFESQISWIGLRRAVAIGAFLSLSVVMSALAQAKAHARTDLTGPADTTRSLFTARDAAVAAGFTVAAIAAFPADQRVARRLGNSNAQNHRFLQHSSTAMEFIAVPGAFVIGGALYGAGRIEHWNHVADLALHTTAAMVLADGIGFTIKGVAGRSRPFAAGDTNAFDFRLGGGFGDDTRGSLPSLHATTAFAAAAAVTAETGKWWPKSTKVVAPLMYVGATLVGVSRMYHGDHWTSDVVLGAGIGTFSGLKIVQYAHAHPTNWLDRTLLEANVSANSQGRVYVGWSRER